MDTWNRLNEREFFAGKSAVLPRKGSSRFVHTCVFWVMVNCLIECSQTFHIQDVQCVGNAVVMFLK